MRARRFRACALCVTGLIACPTALVAQEAQSLRRTFVTASILVSQDRVARFDDVSRFTFQKETWHPAAGVGLGVFFTERWSVRGELEIPMGSASEYQTFGPGAPPSSIIVSWRRTELERRSVTLTGAVAVHPRRTGRVRPAFLIGATVARVQLTQKNSSFTFAGTPWQTLGQSSWSERHTGATMGVDVETYITDAFSVVAQARGTVTIASTEYGSSAIVRLGLATRWRF